MPRKHPTINAGDAIPMVRPPRIEISSDEISRLYLEGRSEKLLAEEFGCSRTAIRRRLIAAGIAPRNRSEAMLLRMAQTSKHERLRLTNAAHEAVRGTRRSLAQMEQSARTKERTKSHATEDERRFGRWLEAKGFSVELQKAIGKYNVDLAVDGTIAVELHLGGWHLHPKHRTREPERVEYLLDAGWNVLTIWTAINHSLIETSAEYLIAWLDQSRRNPTGWREYRVIWGDGKPCASRRLDIADRTGIPSSSHS